MTLPEAAYEVVASPDGRVLYVSYGYSIWVVDPANHVITQTFSLPAGSHPASRMAISPDGSTLAVVTDVSVIQLDAQTGEASRVFSSLDTEFGNAAYAPNGATLWVTSPHTAVVYVIDTRRGTVDSLPLPSSPWGVAVSPDGRTVYVSTQGEVSVIDAGSHEVTQIAVPGVTADIVVSPDGRKLYMTTADNAVVALDIETGTIVAIVDLSAVYLFDLAVSPDGHWVYALDLAGSLYTVDTRTNALVAVPLVGGFAFGVAVAPDGSAVYATAAPLPDEVGYRVAVLPVPTLAGGALAEGVVGSAYAATVVPAGEGPFAFSASGLPDGLSIDPATGEMSGVPTRVGEATVTVTVSNSVLPAQGTYTVRIDPAPVAPALPGGALPAGTTGSRYSAAVVPSAGTAPFRFSADGLPDGLVIDGDSGAITGTPTTSGTVTVTVTVTNAAGAATADYTLVVEAPTAPPTSPAASPPPGAGAEGVVRGSAAAGALATTGSVAPLVASAAVAVLLAAGGILLGSARLRQPRR